MNRDAIVFALSNPDPEVLPEVGLSGFQLVDLFRNGFLQGLDACDVDV